VRLWERERAELCGMPAMCIVHHGETYSLVPGCLSLSFLLFSLTLTTSFHMVTVTRESCSTINHPTEYRGWPQDLGRLLG